MNKPRQLDDEDYIYYDMLFAPIQPFSKYIFYNEALCVELERYKKPVFSGAMSVEVNRFLKKEYNEEFERDIKRGDPNHDNRLKIYINMDSKVISFMRYHRELFRFNFDHYILLSG